MTDSGGSYLIRLGPPSKGDVIHRSDCMWAISPKAKALRWVWADRMGFENIDWDALRRHGIRPCRKCHPETLREVDRVA